MSDKIEKFAGSLIHHGPANQRVYLMHLDPSDGPELIDRLEALAARDNREKIFAKVPGTFANWFTDRAYVVEAEIPPKLDDAPDETGLAAQGLSFVSRFIDPARAEPWDKDLIAKNLNQVEAAPKKLLPPLPAGMHLGALDKDHAPAIAALYKEVFATYPFPIHDPDFICSSMQSGVAYFGVEDEKGALVAVSSAEPAEAGQAVEMTDFATKPVTRGLGLARHLLKRMDEHAQAHKVPLAFTIARARSLGMNLTFARAGYRFAGTLVNNTDISGNLESMNVWYRYL